MLIINLKGKEFVIDAELANRAEGKLTIVSEELTELECYHTPLTSLKLDCPGLVNLYLRDTHLAQLSVSNCSKLKVLCCEDIDYEGQLTELDTTHNPELFELNCYGNQLTKLDVTHNPKLEVLECSKNQLTVLDVGQNPGLTYFYCSENQLTELDVTHNPELQDLSCEQNQLGKLDVTHNPKLEELHCERNQLTELDLRQNLGLSTLYCAFNQFKLDVRQNTKLTELVYDGTKWEELEAQGWKLKNIYSYMSGMEVYERF